MCCDRNAKKLWLSHEKYVEQVIARFNMKDTKPISMPLASHFKLSKGSCPTIDEENERMVHVPYSSIVRSLMYAIVCTRPDIAHTMSLVSRFLSNIGKGHWEVMKRSSNI